MQTYRRNNLFNTEYNTVYNQIYLRQHLIYTITKLHEKLSLLISEKEHNALLQIKEIWDILGLAVLDLSGE